jgi:hypothetical protein
MTRTKRVSKNGLVDMLVGVKVTQRPSCSENIIVGGFDEETACWLFSSVVAAL